MRALCASVIPSALRVSASLNRASSFAAFSPFFSFAKLIASGLIAGQIQQAAPQPVEIGASHAGKEVRGGRPPNLAGRGRGLLVDQRGQFVAAAPVMRSQNLHQLAAHILCSLGAEGAKRFGEVLAVHVLRRAGGQPLVQRVALGLGGRPVRHVLGRQPERLAPCKPVAYLVGQKVDQQIGIAQRRVLARTLSDPAQIVAQRVADGRFRGGICRAAAVMAPRGLSVRIQRLGIGQFRQFVVAFGLFPRQFALDTIDAVQLRGHVIADPRLRADLNPLPAMADEGTAARSMSLVNGSSCATMREPGTMARV